jgi:hypothetical protein
MTEGVPGSLDGVEMVRLFIALELSTPITGSDVQGRCLDWRPAGGHTPPNERIEITAVWQWRPVSATAEPPLAWRYGQVDETILTESTLSRGEDIAAVDVADPAVDEPALDDSSRVPVISTLCPTWGDNLESSASSRYCLPALAVTPDGLDAELDAELELLPGVVVVLALEVAELEGIVAFINK